MASNGNDRFRIALSGFCEREHRVLSSALKLSAARPRHYLSWEGAGQPDVFVLNEDAGDSVSEWSELQRVSGTEIPVLRIGLQNANTSLFRHVPNGFLKRPVLAIRVLNALDNLVSEAYDIAPEMAIHDEMSVESGAGLAPAQTRRVAQGDKRVLVVDDSEAVRKTLEVWLAKKGCSVDFAASGEEGLTKAVKKPYDLIFLDVMLPEMDGYEVSRQIKRNLRMQTPVVMLTGKTSRLDKLRGKLASADAYLTKPLDLTDLNDALQRFLSPATEIHAAG